MSAVITVDRIWKAYPRWDAHSRTLHGFLCRRLPALMRREERTWALRDVSLRLEQGTAVGLIGDNGAGKSTLLRLASGLGRPTRGRIAVPEDVASVLSLGDSFDLSLTGRENAVTAGILSGMSRTQARARTPAILEFAELEAFADSPMRTYSSGMLLRLAFGVVAQLRPSALLLDEVLAVGDLGFQAKCDARIADLRANGTSLLIASHDLAAIAERCDQALWLQAGGVRAAGDAGEVVSAYEGACHSETQRRTPAPDPTQPAAELELRRNRFGSQELTIERVEITDELGCPVSQLVSGAGLTVTLELHNHGRPVEPIVGVAIHRSADGLICVDTTTEAAGVRVGVVEATRTMVLSFDRLDLLPGEYALDVGAYERRWSHAYDYHWNAYTLRVVGRQGDGGVFRPPHSWQLEPR